MDWTKPLKGQQADFIRRLQSGHLLKCEIPGNHSELTVISKERLRQLRDSCWEIAEKYKETSSVRDLFINNLQEKLSQEVVKARLGDLIAEVDYEAKINHNSDIDFTLTTHPDWGIKVKTAFGNHSTIHWNVNAEEVKKNHIIVFILIAEEVSEAQTEYNLIMAGFLPTQLLIINNSEILITIDKLLYSGGLLSYLDYFGYSSEDNLSLSLKVIEQEKKAETEINNNITIEEQIRSYNYLSLGLDRCKEKNYPRAIDDFNQAISLNPHNEQAYIHRGIIRSLVGEHQGAIDDFNQVLTLIPKSVAQCYRNRGVAQGKMGNNLAAIEDFIEAININPNFADAYYNRGVARKKSGDYLGAIEDYTAAIKLNNNYADAYYNRGVTKRKIGDNEGAIEDYTAAIKLHPNYSLAYNNRGVAKYHLGDNQGAIADYNQAIKLNPNYGLAYYNRGVAKYHLGDNQGATADYKTALSFSQQKFSFKEKTNTIINQQESEELLTNGLDNTTERTTI